MDYDLAIIGAGWAGFNAGLLARQLGLKSCLIDKAKLGGTCLNLGCIPTKTLIQSAKLYTLSKKFSDFGLDITCPARLDFKKMQERKDNILQQLSKGMQFMLKGIDFLNAKATILSPQELSIDGKVIKTKCILIATGSKPQELPDLKFDGKKVVSSDDILNLKEIPSSLLIIGGGVIGCEFASLFSSLGTSVCLIEKMPHLLPQEDAEIAKKLETIFKKKGIKVYVNTDVKTFDLKNYELLLVCIGRVAETGDFGLDKIGIKLEKNRIITDETLRTNIDNIYAAGDCTAKICLAHNASYQGRIAAHNIASPDNPKKADNTHIPNCIFTLPQVARVGLTEEEAISKGIEVKINRFDFMASGMARILDETEGFIKTISQQKTGEILGASIIGPEATELIGILTLAVSNQIKVSQVKDTIFAHPTLSESISECLKENHGI